MSQKSDQQFTPTGLTNLVLRQGVYYLRAKVNGQLCRHSLGTKDLDKAKTRFEHKMAELRAQAGKDRDLENAAKFDQAAMLRVFARQTVPQLVKQLARLNQQLEKLNRREEGALLTIPHKKNC